MNPCPVDEIIPELLAALSATSTAVVQSPPGSGKSTRIPPAMLNADWLGSQRVVMLEPRRLAAVNLATWLAGQRGEPVGGTIGYAIRFDRKIGINTRLEIVTEGLLTRRLQDDPYLDGVGAVIFDEYHERSIHADTALSLCRELQQTVRPELRLIIMSATIDRDRMAGLLPDAAVLAGDGGLFPVGVSYLGEPADPVEGVASAVLRALREQSGDILAFLPGSSEIRRTAARLAGLGTGGALVLPLYGDLPFSEQERAIMPGPRRKVVLATNIAETSLTIEGVTTVVDSGLVRRARFDRQRGLDVLVTERISRASSEQRAGRAGRLGPGHCYRLWNEPQQQSLLPFDPPEILTADLAELALSLVLWGVTDPAALTWLDPPPPSAMAAAGRMLRLLGALDEGGRITEFGRRMAGLPLPPRLAALLCRAVDAGLAEAGADLAAILAERDFCRRQQMGAAGADLRDRLSLLADWRSSPERLRNDNSIDPAALRTVERTAGQLRRLVGAGSEPVMPVERDVVQLVATAYPDRLGWQREPGSRRYLLANGSGGELSPGLGPAGQYLVATELGGSPGGEARIFTALGLEKSDLRAIFGQSIVRQRTATWDPASRKVQAREEERLGAIVLTSRPVKATPGEVAAALMEYAGSSGGADLLLLSPAAEQYLGRLALLARLYPDDGWPPATVAGLLATMADWLPDWLAGQEKPERFSGVDPAAVLRSRLNWQLSVRLDELAPTHLTVPTGFRVPLDYTAVDGPVLAVKLQELFGLADTPTVAGGRLPVLLHLLSPAGRPIQVTRDLRSFWNNIYPEVKKELKGRYPKHPWPDDPWSAVPTRFTRKRSG